MLKHYLPYFEQSLGIKVRDIDLTLLRQKEADDNSSHYLLKGGEKQYFLRMPAKGIDSIGRQPYRHLRDSLVRVNRMLADSPILTTLPKLIVISDGIMPPALVESAMPGNQASNWIGYGWSLSRRRTRKIIELGLDWLEQFQEKTAKQRVTVSEMIRTTQTGVELDTFLNMIDNPLDEPQMEILRLLWNSLDKETNITVPLCASHGNFTSANILINKGAIVGVVQWNAFRDEDQPFADIWNLLVHTATCGKSKTDELSSHLTKHLMGMSWYRDLVEKTLLRMAERHDVPLYILRTFLVLHLVRLIIRSRHQLNQETNRTSVWVGLLKRILTFESSKEGLVR